MGLRRRWFVALLAAFLVSCVTVNIYFPAAAIQKAADEIVDDVRRMPPQDKEEKPGKTSLGDRVRLVGFGPPPAHAAVDLDVSTPAIRGLRASMASRFPQLKPLYDKGALGEANNGLVAVRDPGALGLRERADLSRLVDQENADRRALYSEIIKANNLDPGTLGEVQRLFANSWRDKSAPGWWIQRDDGQWVKK